MGTIKRNFSNNVTPTGKFDSADLTGTIPATNVADASLTNITSVPASVGDFVQKVASDPTPASGGDVWYNTTSNALKSVVSLAAWSSGSPLNQARELPGIGSTGTQSASLAVGGRTSGPTAISNTEEYNGSGWATGGSLNLARGAGASFGTQTSAVLSGGDRPTQSPDGRVETEEYNGTSWTTGNPNGVPKTAAVGTGILTAGLRSSGAIGSFPFPVQTTSEEYDGTSWTAGGTMNNGRRSAAGGGTQTATAIFGGDGETAPGVVITELYDGSTWTTGNSLNNAIRYGGGAGIQTSALAFGGLSNPGAVQGITESWDGSSWSNSPATLSTSRYYMGSSGSSNSSVVTFAGQTGPSINALTEEYNKSTNVITPGAWASGGNLNTTRSQGNLAGIQTAGLFFGGETPPGATPGNTEEYNGSTWTTVNSLSNGRFDLGLGSAGTQTAALGAGGFRNDTGLQSSTEEYDGTNWTSGGGLPTGIYEHGVFGTQTAGVVHNGTTPTIVNTTVEYDGSTWSAGGNSSDTTRSRGGAGTISAGIGVGGRPGPSSYISNVENYDGTSWTSGTSFFRTIQNTAIGGTQTATLIGNNPLASPSLYSATFDGTGWATAPSLATGRQRLAGTTQLAIAASGSGSEEFTGETSAANVKTISTS